ncbi:hypothetical protein B0G76_2834 [Paraburkholderia sp. BL23I1N1]|uniref:hypothetical protein n=1 Tax=Paraburkholderia sp. BL23I1N1 TaxID=1938802 RepID=UPI000E72A025|nr:hypothetical protein [Paraburkholderia sp. BL23I1N1]RKE36632.1 hypothetical protein B0G76_2834 [Paraburkholderia sp. BL23I1N1]
MDNYKDALVAALKTVPAWLGLAIGHAIDSITLSGIALIASTVYSVVQTYVTIRRERRARSIE